MGIYWYTIQRNLIALGFLHHFKSFKIKSNQYSFNWQNTTTDTDAKVVYKITSLAEVRTGDTSSIIAIWRYLRAATAGALSPEFSTIKCKFYGFHPILNADLRRIISSSNQKSCELDPLPPFIIINILDDIIAFLVYMFNRSL